MTKPKSTETFDFDFSPKVETTSKIVAALLVIVTVPLYFIGYSYRQGQLETYQTFEGLFPCDATTIYAREVPNAIVHIIGRTLDVAPPSSLMIGSVALLLAIGVPVLLALLFQYAIRKFKINERYYSHFTHINKFQPLSKNQKFFIGATVVSFGPFLILVLMIFVVAFVMMWRDTFRNLGHELAEYKMGVATRQLAETPEKGDKPFPFIEFVDQDSRFTQVAVEASASHYLMVVRDSTSKETYLEVCSQDAVKRTAGIAIASGTR